MSKYLAAIFAIVQVVSSQAYNSESSVYTSNTASVGVISTAALLDANSTGSSTVTPDAGTEAASVATGVTSVTASPSVATTSPYLISSVFYSCLSTVLATGPFVTVYNTVYLDVCPTGTIYRTYTITDTCGCTHSTDYTRPTGCPTGFTVTTKTCTACPGSPLITVTQPVNNPTQVSTPTTYTDSNLTPVSSPGTEPTYQVTSGATLGASNTVLGSLMVLAMALVAGLLCVL